jgi:NTE family protein
MPEDTTRAAPLAPLNLALQGGGSHGALTWGVLDALLEDGRFAFEGISGTSAGAMNAVAVAHGFAQAALQHQDARDAHAAGCALARQTLARLWEGVGTLGSLLWGVPLQGNPVLGLMAQWLSPYQTNPLDINPLRRLLEREVDFDALCHVRGARGPRVFVCATNVRTGRGEIFSGPRLSADAVMASACLPLLFKAVQIDGEHYWDGGFTANPAVYPLIYDCTTPDILLVLLNPLRHPEAPRSAEEIAQRSMELGFSTTFLREMRTLAQARAYLQEGGGWLPRGRLERKLAGLRFHLLEAEELAEAGKGSKLNATRAFLHELRDLGRARAARWIRMHRADVGRRETVDVAGVFA